MLDKFLIGALLASSISPSFFRAPTSNGDLLETDRVILWNDVIDGNTHFNYATDEPDFLRFTELLPYEGESAFDRFSYAIQFNNNGIWFPSNEYIFRDYVWNESNRNIVVNRYDREGSLNVYLQDDGNAIKVAFFEPTALSLSAYESYFVPKYFYSDHTYVYHTLPPFIPYIDIEIFGYFNNGDEFLYDKNGIETLSETFPVMYNMNGERYLHPFPSYDVYSNPSRDFSINFCGTYNNYVNFVDLFRFKTPLSMYFSNTLLQSFGSKLKSGSNVTKVMTAPFSYEGNTYTSLELTFSRSSTYFDVSAKILSFDTSVILFNERANSTAFTDAQCDKIRSFAFLFSNDVELDANDFQFSRFWGTFGYPFETPSVVGNSTNNIYNVFELFGGVFAGLSSVLGIYVLPYMTIGMLLCVPLVVVVVLAVVKLFKR